AAPGRQLAAAASRSEWSKPARARERTAPAGSRRDPPPLRSGARAAVAPALAAAGGGGLGAVVDDAPHYHRWLVDAGALARTEPGLPRSPAWPHAVAARLADPVRRLRPLATPVVTGSAPGSPTGLLARALSWPGALAVAHRPPSPQRAKLSRGAAGATPLGHLAAAAAGLESPGRGDAVHDAAGRLAARLAALQRPKRPRGGHPHCQPQPGRAGRLARLLRQHAGLALPAGGASQRARVAGTGARGDPGGLQPSRGAL